jgi:hypothetical protein
MHYLQPGEIFTSEDLAARAGVKGHSANTWLGYQVRAGTILHVGKTDAPGRPQRRWMWLYQLAPQETNTHDHSQ